MGVVAVVVVAVGRRGKIGVSRKGVPSWCCDVAVVVAAVVSSTPPWLAMPWKEAGRVFFDVVDDRKC